MSSNASIKTQALYSLRPGAEWAMQGEEETLQWLDTEQTEPTAQEIADEIARLQADEPWQELRERRNLLLAQTDYLALSDVTLTEDMRTYRQALRDLPANTTDPANPTWPTKP